MFSQVLAGLGRLIPKSPPTAVASPDSAPERGWHGSSYDLAQGLEVTEIDIETEGQLPLFADAQAAWQPLGRVAA